MRFIGRCPNSSIFVLIWDFMILRLCSGSRLWSDLHAHIFFFFSFFLIFEFYFIYFFIQQVLISHQYYTHQCIHVNPNRPIQHTTIPTPPWLSPLGVHTFVLYICVSISALQTGSSVPCSRFHIHALIYDICFSLSDLLHSVWQSLDPSTSQQKTQFHSFLWLSNIPLYICTTPSLSIRLSIGI